MLKLNKKFQNILHKNHETENDIAIDAMAGINIIGLISEATLDLQKINSYLTTLKPHELNEYVESLKLFFAVLQLACFRLTEIYNKTMARYKDTDVCKNIKVKRMTTLGSIKVVFKSRSKHNFTSKIPSPRLIRLFAEKGSNQNISQDFWSQRNSKEPDSDNYKIKETVADCSQKNVENSSDISKTQTQNTYGSLNFLQNIGNTESKENIADLVHITPIDTIHSSVKGNDETDDILKSPIHFNEEKLIPTLSDISLGLDLKLSDSKILNKFQEKGEKNHLSSDLDNDINVLFLSDPRKVCKKSLSVPVHLKPQDNKKKSRTRQPKSISLIHHAEVGETNMADILQSKKLNLLTDFTEYHPKPNVLKVKTRYKLETIEYLKKRISLCCINIKCRTTFSDMEIRSHKYIDYTSLLVHKKIYKPLFGFNLNPIIREPYNEQDKIRTFFNDIKTTTQEIKNKMCGHLANLKQRLIKSVNETQHTKKNEEDILYVWNDELISKDLAHLIKKESSEMFKSCSDIGEVHSITKKDIQKLHKYASEKLAKKEVLKEKENVSQNNTLSDDKNKSAKDNWKLFKGIGVDDIKRYLLKSNAEKETKIVENKNKGAADECRLSSKKPVFRKQEYLDGNASTKVGHNPDYNGKYSQAANVCQDCSRTPDFCQAGTSEGGGRSYFLSSDCKNDFCHTNKRPVLCMLPTSAIPIEATRALRLFS